MSQSFFVFEGVRYFMRGIDDKGHSANFVETEQMAFYLGKASSFVQVFSDIFES